MMGVAPVLILALLASGQAPPTPPRAPGTHVMYDASGKGWSSPDPAKLLAFVRDRNKQIEAGKAAPKGGADVNHPPAPRNYGIDTSKIPRVKSARRWGSPGAYESGEVATPVGKTARLHVTAIGPEAEAAVAGWRANAAFAALESELGDRLAVQAFAADNPLVADVGLPDGGRPDVVIQTETGKVVYRSHSDPGAAAMVGYVRERSPGYDPSKDPASTGVDMPRVALWGAVAVAAILLIKGRPE